MSKSRSQQKSDLSITDREATEIGQRIRTLRGPVRQKVFATRIGITREQLWRIESRGQVPSSETLRRLAQATGVSLNDVLLGADAAKPAADSSWETAVASILGGTMLRLPRTSAASARRAERAWKDLPEARREEVRAFVRRIALVAVATEALLPAKAARAVVDQLGTELSTVLIDRIVAAS